MNSLTGQIATSASAQEALGPGVSGSESPAGSFEQSGYFGPVPVLSRSQAHWLSRHLHQVRYVRPPDWHKARASIDPVVARIARDGAIVERLRPYLGDDILLWSAHMVSVPPVHGHAWHVDIETAVAEGPTISVWVGLSNAGAKTGLTIVPGSHRFESILQRCTDDAGIPYGNATDQDILQMAREQAGAATLESPVVRDGEALFFHGRLWHRSFNALRIRSRRALLLQYAPADVAMRIPDLEYRDWPFRLLAAPRPPSILVSGRSPGVTNRIVPPPAPEDRADQTLSTLIYPYDLPLEEDPEQGWKPYHCFHGQTPNLDLLGCHVSVLSPGACPHPPHQHDDEEILIVLDGEAEVLIATSPSDQNPRVERLRRHQFSYYPAGQHHTIRNPGEQPVTYMMLRWRGSAAGARWPLETQIIDPDAKPARPVGNGLSVRTLLDDPTGILSKLHVHVSEMAPGGGYDPHVDAYDAAILMLEGEIDMMGNKITPYGILLLAAGEPHGIRNPGDRPARYLVFELHRNTPFMQDAHPLIRKARRQKARARRFAGRVLKKLGVRS